MKNKKQRLALKLVGGVAGALLLCWAGLRRRPSNLPFPEVERQDYETLDLPPDLPEPVRRYLRVALGESIPQIETLSVYGRAEANFGFWVPLRYRLVHHAGHAFERYMEVTWFGLPILKAIDRYFQGKGKTGPLGHEAVGPAVDQGANMILWAEGPLMPSIWASECLRWESIDETTARLVFPFGDETDELTVSFDPKTGLVSSIKALRFREPDGDKEPWRVDFLSWHTKDGVTLPTRIAVVWELQGEAWSYWDIEKVYWNRDVSDRL